MEKKKGSHGRDRRWAKRLKRGEIIQERQQIPRGRSERGGVMEMNGERHLGGREVTSESVRRSDRGIVSFRENLVAGES